MRVWLINHQNINKGKNYFEQIKVQSSLQRIKGSGKRGRQTYKIETPTGKNGQNL